MYVLKVPNYLSIFNKHHKKTHKMFRTFFVTVSPPTVNILLTYVGTSWERYIVLLNTCLTKYTALIAFENGFKIYNILVYINCY